MREGAATESGWQRALALSIVPLAVLLGLGAALWMMRAGVEPAQAILPVSIAAFLLVAVFERVLPWNRAWNHSRGDLRSDALYIPTQLGVGALFSPLVASLSVAGGGWLSQ